MGKVQMEQNHKTIFFSIVLLEPKKYIYII